MVKFDLVVRPPARNGEIVNIHPLYIAMGVKYDGLDPEQHSMAELALSVVNPERDRPPLYSVVRPVHGSVSSSEARMLEACGLPRSRRIEEGMLPSRLMPLVVEWLDEACWLNYRPVLVSPDVIGAVFLREYLLRYSGTDPFDNDFLDLSHRASRHSLGFGLGLSERPSFDSALLLAAELRRRPLLEPTPL